MEFASSLRAGGEESAPGRALSGARRARRTRSGNDAARAARRRDARRGDVPRQRGDEGLSQEQGGDCEGIRRRLVSLRRSRRHLSRRLYPAQGPLERHHHLRRRKHFLDRSRRGAVQASGRAGGGGGRRARRQKGRDAVRVRGTKARYDGDCRGTDRLVPHPPRRLQMPAHRRVFGNSEDEHRQAAKIQAAGDGEGDVTKLAKTRDQYHDMRRCYLPGNMRLVIVAESPPVSGLYFYDAKGKSTEPLFSALMKQLAFSPGFKEDGLKEFQRRGWILVDATYEPVNTPGISNRDRDDIIQRDYPLLRADLEGLLSDRSTPLILIKANIYRLLKNRLIEDTFNVLNDRSLPFPSTGHQTEFYNEFAAILKSTGLVV